MKFKIQKEQKIELFAPHNRTTNKVGRYATNKMCKMLPIALIFMLLKVLNLNFSPALLEIVELTTSFVLLLTFLLHHIE